MVVSPFGFSRSPRIVFGNGALADAGRILAGFGSRALVVTGAGSLASSGGLDALLDNLQRHSLEIHSLRVAREPSPELVDSAVSANRGRGIEVVLAVGGGSVLDAGKAVSAMLRQGGSVVEFLEGVGTGAGHSGVKVPFVAAPTTAGTGSEATANAVLSQVGPRGFKKSLRHNNFVPDVALVDPELALSCPARVTAACGMDAFTQLLESYLSTNASPMTDALAWSGLEHVAENLMAACTEEGGRRVEVRAGMAYAALMSGMTLANAGLGLVHGMASALGGLFDIPHGVVCGTMMGVVNTATFEKLVAVHGMSHPALAKYARVGSMLAGRQGCSVETGCRLLLETIDEWTVRLEIPRLGDFGVKESDLDAIVALSANKNNPVALDSDEIRALLRTRL